MLKISNLTLSFRKKKVLKSLNLSLPSNGLFSIIGANGVGKTTLLRVILGSISNYRGSIEIDNKEQTSYKKRDLAKLIAITPQEFFPKFDFKAKEIVLMGRYPYLKIWQNFSKNDEKLVETVLSKVKMNSFAFRSFNSLSGGEKQKINIARVLVQDTKIILMDETLAQLDINHQIEIISIIKELSKTKLILIVSHNINLASEFSDELIVLKDGKVAYKGNSKTIITKQNISHCFDIKKFEIFNNPKTKKPYIFYR